MKYLIFLLFLSLNCYAGQKERLNVGKCYIFDNVAHVKTFVITKKFEHYFKYRFLNEKEINYMEYGTLDIHNVSCYD